MAADNYPHLFAPLHSGRLQLKNRVVHAAITTRMALSMRASAPLIQYYANRARGGAAMVVTEPLSMARNQTLAHKVRAWDDAGNDDLKRWADAVESQDCRLIGQIQDSGRGRHEKGRNPQAIGVSAQPDDLSWTVPRALESAEIAQMVAEFAESAARLQRCGFSGVELSCGHGHLFHQFMSLLSNNRDDAYGGSFDNRLRFVRDIIAAVRAACASTFVVGLKLPGDDGLAGGIGPQEAARIATALADPRVVDYVCFTWGLHGTSLDLHIPDMHWPRAPFVSVTRALGAACNGVPVMAVGLITDPAEADAIVARGDASLIGLGRPLITDPAWPLKAASNRERDIRYCVSCNTCWGTIVEGKPVVCDNNPRVGKADEVDYWPKRSLTTQRVVIVGAGIAGMEAAWIAAARGHDVTVFGNSSDCGGKTRLHAALPGGEHLSSIYDYQLLAARKAGARLEFGVRASLDDVLACNPQTVLLAAGSELSWPVSLPAALRESGAILDLRAAMMALLGLAARQPGTALIWDMDATEGTYAAAEYLYARFDHVVIATARERIAQDIPLVSQLGLWRRINQKRIRVVPFVEMAGDSDWEAGCVSLRNVYNGDRVTIENVALASYATPRLPNLDLLAPLQVRGINVLRIGDCLAPRSVLAATSEGHAAGQAL